MESTKMSINKKIKSKIAVSDCANESDYIAVRRKIIESLYMAGGGHYGGSLSVIDILLVLYNEILDLNSSDFNRDRIILSKGHAAIALYATLAQLNIIDEKSLKNYGQYNVGLEGHPDMTQTRGIDFSSGSLGQGLSVGIGMAFKLCELNRHVWVILGDGECQEGQIWEAAMLAARYQLDNIHVIVDANGAQEFGFKHNKNIAQEPIPNMVEKWKAFGWETQVVNGHSHSQLKRACLNAMEVKQSPSIIIAKTRKGAGVPMFEKNPEHFHCITLTEQEHYQALKELKCNNN